MSGGLSTHVLDLARGRPAADLFLTLRREGQVIYQGRTNSDGRCPEMSATVGAPQAGAYQLVFDVAAYLAAQGIAPAFFPTATIDFVITDPASHHHVPLLLSPFGYSTYRGS